MNINKLINEEINRYLYNNLHENSFYEKSNSKENDDDDSYYGGDRKNANDQYAAELEQDADSGELNIRKLASKISGIPTSTKNKANVNKLNSIQSALRKKIKREDGFNGGTMHLNDDEVSQIARARR